ncbi:MAG: aspartate kinase [Deltaproteobacteria bacterium]|nr:aspartate kinase [Deltaproteobacteria bacterium]
MRIVQKYGGSSMGSVERIGLVADRVARTHALGHAVVVVVSAMQGETDRLIKLAGRLSDRPRDREIDVLLATGEQVSIALLALALRERGVEARSFLGHQVRILTDSIHGSARIQTIDAAPVHDCLDKGEVVVVAGFQGVDQDGNITTLGRGGSDLSAVAMAAAIKADACEIYSDVDGIYTTDPNICAKARRIDRISCEEMLELASLGAKVLQARSVEFALKHKVAICCKSTFDESGGSWVLPDAGTLEGMDMAGLEGAVVTGVACDRNTARFSVSDIPNRPGAAAALFQPLADDAINVDVIIQTAPRDGRCELSFTVPKGSALRTRQLLDRLRPQMGFGAVTIDDNVAKVSIVGAGMRSQPGVALRAFQAMGQAGIDIQLISTSEIKISMVVDDRFTEAAVRVLHDAFALDRAGGGR